VGDDRGEVPEFPVRSSELFLRAFALGNIHDVAQYGHASRILDLCVSPLDPDDGPIFLQPPRFVFRRRLLPLYPLRPDLVRHGPVLGMNQSPTLDTDQFLLRVPVHVGQHLVGEYDPFILVDIDAGQGILDQCAVLLLALP